MSTQTHEEGEPPHLPLDVMLGYRTPEGMFVDEFVVVRPGDDDYEHAYAYAARRYLQDGEPMPYASVEGLAAGASAASPIVARPQQLPPQRAAAPRDTLLYASFGRL